MVPLPWERLLWSGRPMDLIGLVRGVRYALTDFRLVRIAGACVDEIALDDIADIQLTRSRLDRVLRTSTLRVESRRTDAAPLIVTGIRRATQLAALLELLSGHPRAYLDADAVGAALVWEPRTTSDHAAIEAIGAMAVVAVALVALAISVRVHTIAASDAAAAYAADDPVYPMGHKRSHAEIVRFMETEVMPWARRALGPLKGGESRITCETCHGRNPDARQWQMPAVAALPQPGVKDEGWERYGGPMDAQMRNAIYGYLAESENQSRAGYMRQRVMPGMAQLLHRPAYDFTRTYAYNRSQLAFGCYHCHRVK
jgi:hypothetical protein